jgi:hypothetical protein
MKKALVALALFVIAVPAMAAEYVPVKRGLWKVFKYENPDETPIIFSGWSKAVDAFALEYSIFLDVFYTDGSAAWGRKADFRLGTHDWEEAKGVFVPKKPVKKIEVYALFRSKAKGEKTKGSVKFRDFSLERREGKGETFSTFFVTDRPFSSARAVTKTVFKGRGFKTTTVNEQDPSPVVSPVPSGKTVVWTEDSMRLVTPLTFPSASAKNDISLSLAKRERESAQILVSTAANVERRAVTIELPVLKRKDGTVFRGKVDWRRQGYLAREHGANRHPYSFPENERWFPDPLLPPAPMRVRPASTQGAWLTVYAAPDALPGEYRGTVVVRDGSKVLAKVPMAVTVRDFSLPETFGLETAYTLMDGFTRAIYPECYREKKREAIDIMLDHRLNPDDISRTTPPEIEDLLYARSRGMNRFNILNIVPPPKNPDARWVLTCSEKAIADPKFYDYFVGVVKPYVDRLREHGLDKLAYVYGFDERPKEFNSSIEAFWKRFQNDVPGIPMMTTAKNYQDFVRGKITGPLACDWFCPTTDAYDVEVSERLRKEGKKVWWYVCCSPTYPYANFASWEYPPIEGRLLGWMTHLYRADGFLFWIVNKWHGKSRMNGDDTYFPSYRTHNNNGMPGDGIMMYPGEKEIWPSIKLAQCRDGVEDYEYLQLAAAKAGVAASDNVTKTIVTTRTQYSRSPERLRKAREQLSSIISNGR